MFCRVPLCLVVGVGLVVFIVVCCSGGHGG